MLWRRYNDQEAVLNFYNIFIQSPKGDKGGVKQAKKVPSQRLINKQPLKVTPTKKLSHLPGKGKFKGVFHFFPFFSIFLH